MMGSNYPIGSAGVAERTPTHGYTFAACNDPPPSCPLWLRRSRRW